MQPQFQIHKHACGYWSITSGEYLFDRAGWDEMLGAVARMLISGSTDLLKIDRRIQRGPAEASVYRLTVTAVRDTRGDFGYWYSIRRGERFIDMLTPDESLGFIAAYTCTDGEKQLFHGLRTYEQWARESWNQKREIAGLLECSAI